MTVLPNLRDLEGARREDGRLLRPHRLLRSATLAAISPAAAEELTARAGTGTYVDLRTDAEIDRDGLPDALLATGWAWHRIPVRDKVPGYEGDTSADALRRYVRALPQYIEAAAEVGGLLGDRPVLVSCSLGKDRTGLVVAIVLAWLTVERAGILADFAKSNDHFPKALAVLPPRWRAPKVAVARVDPQVCGSVLKSLRGTSGLPAVPADVVDRLFTDRARINDGVPVWAVERNGGSTQSSIRVTRSGG